MKIGVNARLLTRPFTGIGQYTKNLFRELGEIDKKNEYVLVVPCEIDKGSAEWFAKNVKIVVVPEKKSGTGMGTGAQKTWWEQTIVPEFFEKEKVDVAFFTYPSAPWSKDWYKKKIKTVITAHDCIPWKFKEYRRGVLSKMYHLQSKKAVKNADIIFTVSKHSKKDIVEFCGADEKKIHVVYNDAAEVYKKPVDKNLAENLLKNLGIEKEKYFFYVGGFDARKNVRKLIEEFEIFSHEKHDISLVLAGGKLFQSELYESFDLLKKADGKIVKTGFLTEEELKALYANCLAFVHFSKEEGFNIPLLEAANCGAPLILSDISVHKEVAVDSAIFVDLEDKGEGARAMEKVLNKKVRVDLSKKSRELAKKYSWKTSAKKVLDVLNSLHK